jgi:hypothetical protein
MVSLSVRMKDPTKIIEAGPGVYFLESEAPVDELVSLAEERSISVFRLDAHHISDKATFLREAAVSMHFPAYFGDNWDSFEECIRDLEWPQAHAPEDKPEALDRAYPIPLS